MIDRLLGRDLDSVPLQPGVQLEAGGAEEGGGAGLVAVRALEGIHDGLPLQVLQRTRGAARRGRSGAAGGVGAGPGRSARWAAVMSVPSEVIRLRSMAFCSGIDPSRRVYLEAEVAGNLLKSHELSRLPIGIVPQFLRHQRCHARSRLPGNLGI